ncbi:MAG: hypothetical protein KDJ26_07005 [Alphaproteobacteria bacterium]|nr:hypothetical protein [Alphaproteobacteria bacterium]MCB1551731.1 hypothetical protein [Alphaproteobacteria bacterium]MCB9985713.1 hypothetical protein [Micavibrio sp.]HPQ50078.1 hypothetical protein [Alphaproteobacteria bacterium]HRK97655.1 hypothetical protein [Alphaproteobacteria bacterium]
MTTMLIAGCLLFGLSACAIVEGEQPQSPSVRAAKACMKQLKQKITESPEYYIGACTNTGVWMVERRDLQSGQKLAEYDFVNKMYAGQETGGGFVSVDSLGGTVEQSFQITQKQLNAALLKAR